MDIKSLDNELEGIYSTPGIILIYGPAGSGKSLFCLLSIRYKKISKGKIVYIDGQSNAFPYLRLKQIYSNIDFMKDIKDQIFFIHPKDFNDQSRIISNISKLKENIGIIIIDNMTYLYRLEKGGYGKSYRTSKKLIEQVETLAEISKNLAIPIVISSHVYSIPKEGYKDPMKDYEVVGGRILENKAIYRIALSDFSNKKRAVIIDNKDGKENRQYFFRITQSGIEEIP